MTDGDLFRLRVKLSVAKDIAKDFRTNTTLDTIIKEYVAKVKHHEKKTKPYEPTRGC